MLNIVISIALCLICLLLGWLARWMYGRYKLTSVEQMAIRVAKEATEKAEAIRKEIVLEGKDAILKERQQLDREARESKLEIQKNERRLQLKEENLEAKQEALENTKFKLADKEKELIGRETIVSEQEKNWVEELERVSQLSCEQAKALILEKMGNEAKHDGANLVAKIEQEYQLIAEKKARDIVVSTMQRIASDVSSETTTTTVSLPSEDMKGRIIGREGRNIRALETLTGVDVIIDDTPEAVVISCFDPVRKEIARNALERLVLDGRIHPARIEEVVGKVEKEIDRIIMEEGEKVVFDLGINTLSPRAIKQLGRLHFRTSYGQNVLKHSKEVAILAGMIAAEVGANRDIAMRGGLLHDVGKGIVSEGDANHAELGADLAKKLGEDPRVVNAIHSHHDDVEPSCIESVIVKIADSISGARPGARNEFDTYTNRLKNLEEIATSFDGVDKAFAIQAGRELRIIVKNDVVTDEGAKEIAKGIASRIEAELRYPGRITVTTIRETRITEYAR